ncbi:MAG: formyltransferase family protein [Pseudobdellovibrio sp.]
MLSGLRKPARHAVFISGGGSTLQALLEMQHQINISLVVTNKKDALGALKAKRFGKTILHFNKDMSFEKLNHTLKLHNIDFIILAGFLKILPETFVNEWENKIINIHPSLLPLYPGLHSAEKNWEDNNDMGVTIHKVITEMDAGKIIIQQKCLTNPKSLAQQEALFFLRRTEQFLLREIAVRGF